VNVHQARGVVWPNALTVVLAPRLICPIAVGRRRQLGSRHCPFAVTRQSDTVKFGSFERNDRIWTPPHFASTPYSGAKVRLLTYIRPQYDLDHPRSGHDGLFARRLLIGSAGFAPIVIPRLFRRRFNLFAIIRDARNRGG